jgi:hypothetical protein
MMGKQFEKKFMHPTRRKLVDMVQTGEYSKPTQVSFSNTNIEVQKNVGDTWEDKDGNLWEQKDWGKIKKSKSSDTLTHVRQYLQSISKCTASNCDVSGTYSNSDKKLISKTGFCAGCLAKREQQIQNDGLWEEYSKYKVYSNMAAYGTEVLQQLTEALQDVTNIHEYVNEDGSVEVWKDNSDIQLLKSQIETDIENAKKELSEVIEIKNSAYELLKNKNYELVQKI